MIKFWKNAAKGKSVFPVRPPESNPVRNIAKGLSLDTIQENEDHTHVFEKKSQLSLSLDDILSNRSSLKYFMQFMQSIGQIIILKCWLELEDFRITILAKKSTKSAQSKPISRTRSFNIDWNIQEQSNREFLLHASKLNSNNTRISKHALSNGDFSSSSCENLTEKNPICDESVNGRNEKDGNNLSDQAVSLFKKYVALEAPQSVHLPDDIRKSVISNICNPHGQINDDCFKPVLDFLLQQMESKYLNEFQDSAFYMKAQIDILTSGSLSLNDILYNESILFYFTEYLEQECCSLLLEFLMAVRHFRDNLLFNNSSEPHQGQDDAIIIYEKYFSLQAITPIGFPTEVRLRVESDICREGGPEYSCFDIPYQIVFKTLSNYLKSFLGSEVYYKYLTEMINSVDQMWSHQRSQSDCSSEYSVSTQNTLLAMGDQVFHRKKRNHSVPDMTIDSNQLYNADALWQRKRQDGLCLGRINSLGRFESKFEPDPDKKDKSVLKKMVSRFVPSSSSKDEEEMAWQIAHMIVKDVTDLTMAPPDNDHDSV